MNAEIIRFLGATRAAKWLRSLDGWEGTLGEKAVRGGLWVLALRVVTRSVSFVRTMVLARLLAPEDFGLMGVAMLTLSILQTFSEPGVRAALVQRKDDSQPYLDAAWTVQVVRGVVITSVLIFSAPLLGVFFDEARAVPLIRALGVSVLAGSLANIGIVRLTKELAFHRHFLYEFAGTLADLVVVVPLALLLRNVWALVFAVLAKAVVQLVVSYAIHEHRPSFRVDWPRTKELLSFGRWILGSSIVVFLLTQGDDMFLARFIGASALGLYQMAYTISNTPATEISHTVYRITFPAFSKLQEDSQGLRWAFLSSIQLIALASLPLAIAIAAAAPYFVRVVLGSQWVTIVPTVQILCLYGAMRSISYGTLFQAVGRPQLQAIISGAKLVLLAALIYPLTDRWQTNGTALAVVLSDMPLKVIATKKALVVAGVRWREFLRLLAIPLLASIPMAGAIVGLLGLVPGFWGLVLAALSGGLTYLGGLLLLDSLSPRYGLRTLVRRLWRSVA